MCVFNTVILYHYTINDCTWYIICSAQFLDIRISNCSTLQMKTSCTLLHARFLTVQKPNSLYIASGGCVPRPFLQRYTTGISHFPHKILEPPLNCIQILYVTGINCGSVAFYLLWSIHATIQLNCLFIVLI